MSRFEISLRRVLGLEGGLSDHAMDRGGRTNFGITHITLNAARQDIPNLPEKVDDLTFSDVQLIYRMWYWDRVKADEIPAPIDFSVFDAAVNHGPGWGVRFLQRALNDLRVTPVLLPDGAIGPRTLGAIKQVFITDLLEKYNARRIEFYMNQPPDQINTFGKGWANRMAHVIRAAYEDLAEAEIEVEKARASGQLKS